MASKLFQQLNNNCERIDYLKLFKSTKNPQQLLLNMAATNNKVASVLKEVQDNGGDAKSLFYKKASQMGIDPNQILNQLR